MKPIRNRRLTRHKAAVINTASRTHHTRLIPFGFCPFAPNERSQIRTYVARDTYRQGVLSPSI
nr:MAG TPA: hypothetical protein [Caudoviricetes sp.]